MSEALRQGLTRKTLYGMRDAGIIEPLSRGTYRLKDLPPLEQPDLVVVARRIPHGVICLVSALAFHGLTTQIPHEVYVAIRRGTERPRLDYPPTRLFVVSLGAFEDGIDLHTFDGTPVRIYDPEKSVADAFKFRHRIGADIAIEALRRWSESRKKKLSVLLRYARHCRVEKLLRIHLETLL